MKNQIEKHHIGKILAGYAAQTVPNDLDLWPAISKELQARQFRERDRSLVRRALPILGIRRLALVSAIAAILAVVLVATGFPPGNQQGASASAAEALNRLALVAAAQPIDPKISLSGVENVYRYIKSEEMNTATIMGKDSPAVTALVPKTREFWIAPDGSGRIRETAASPVFLSDRDRANWEATVPSSRHLAMNQDFGPGGLFYEDFTRYPTVPKALADVIRRRAEAADPPVDVEMFIVVGDLLRMPGVPPELRSALYKVAAKIKGVELIGNVTDRAGRQGVAVSIITDYWKAKQRMTLIFDPSTSTLLGEEKVLLEKADWVDTTPPVVIGYATYLESSLVTKLP